MTPAQQHKAHAPRHVRVYVLTVSDTRTDENDEGGRVCRELVESFGHTVVGKAIVRDEPTLVQAVMGKIADEQSADVIISTGGTGISRRDSTVEAVSSLLEKRLDGFGELFRYLSYAEIGSPAMLSRAVAGLCRGLVIFAVPGSPHAVRLAMEKLIGPELGHLKFEARR
jgi:molybdenum cofactor biosynthesis protein B